MKLADNGVSSKDRKRHQTHTNDCPTYFFHDHHWVFTDIASGEIKYQLPICEKSELSGDIHCCGVKSKVFIFRFPESEAWFIEYHNLVGKKRRYGCSFSSDEEALESFLTAFFDDKICDLCIKKGFVAQIR